MTLPPDPHPGGGVYGPAHDFGPGPIGKPITRLPTIDSGDLRELTLWRVASFSKAWVDNEPGAPEPAGTTVSTRRVLKEVEGMLADKPWCITIQQQP